MIRQYHFFLLETLVDHVEETESVLDRERQRVGSVEAKLDALRANFEAIVDERTSKLRAEMQVRLDEQNAMSHQLEVAQLNLQSRQIEQSVVLRGRIDGAANEFKTSLSMQQDAIRNEVKLLREHISSLSESTTLAAAEQSAALEEVRQSGIAKSAELAASALAQQSAGLDEIRQLGIAQSAELVAKLETYRAVFAEQIAQIAQTGNTFQTSQLLDATAGLERQFSAQLKAEASGIQINIDQSHAKIANELKALATEREHLSAQLADFGRFTYQTRAELTLQSRRISILLEELRRSPRQVTEGEAPIAPAKSRDHEYDALYLAFEDIFRGTRQQIKDRQSVYIPILTASNIGTRKMPILDLGSGRGEWLEVLRDQGLNARGVDHNQSMVEQCEALGLHVTLDNAVEHLRGIPDASLGAITSFHMVEHLPFGLVLKLVDEALRVLKPEGLLILETPNPENLQVGAFTFHYDPTHLRPLPPGMLHFFVEARGFCDVRITQLHPYAEAVRLPEDGPGVAERFNQLFYGPQDYSVIGKRP